MRYLKPALCTERQPLLCHLNHLFLPAHLTCTPPSIFHPLPPLSASCCPPLSPATLIRLIPPFMTFPFLSPVLQCSPPHISLYSSSFLPFAPPHQLLSPPILIRSTLRLLLAAFPFSTSALLPPPPPSLCPSSLPVPRYSADLSPVRLRPAEMDTPPGKQVRQNRLEGGGKWRDQWQRRTCR